MMLNFFRKRWFFGRRGEKAGPDGKDPGRRSFATTFEAFQKTLELNNLVLEKIAALGDVLSGDYVFDRRFIETGSREIADIVYRIIASLNVIVPRKYLALYDAFHRINQEIEEELSGRPVIPRAGYVMPRSMMSRDFEDVVGGKNAHLAEVANAVGLHVPDGFAVTTRAFAVFMERNGLWRKAEDVFRLWSGGDIPLSEASRRLQSLVVTAELPAEVRREMERAVDQLERSRGIRAPSFAVRSSAVEEDGEHSFAGLYLSLLNVPGGELPDAYRCVLTSLYSPAALEYRRDKGFAENEVAMAVGFQVMVDAEVSGIVYTVDPNAPESGRMLISSARGLGLPVVSGEIGGDQHLVERADPHEIRPVRIDPQASMLEPNPGGGTRSVPVDTSKQGVPCLDDDRLRHLAEAGLQIERHFKRPQDIEYAFDRQGTLYILQARPLHINMDRVPVARDLPGLLAGYRVIFEGRGVVAQRGVGAGKAYLIEEDEDLERFPSGAVLVARHTSPRFAEIVRRASAILTDVGSPTGHLATIAREFRVPAIVGTETATTVLRHGQDITVDAEGGKVYDGIVKELQLYQRTEELIEESPEYRLLRRILKKIAPLNLVDPHSRRFTPQGAKTFHDITRFVHEKAVEELISLQNVHRHDPETFSGKLKLSVPLDLVLIDIGEGLAEGVTSQVIEPDEITSLPMRAFVEGLIRPGAWSTDPAGVDFGSFMSSLTRTFASGLSSPEQVGQNLAVISINYANISLRLGYHFNMIDAYIGPHQNSNYAYFRFLGGVTDPTRLSRRARFLADVLAANDFRVEVRGDLVVARLKKLPEEVMREKLYLLGVLVAYSRQLDVQMASERHVGMYAERFRSLMQSNPT